MAKQYYMRAYNTNLGQYVDWVVNDAPDTTGTYSGYSTGDLSNIVVNRVTPSKIENFLKSNQSLGGYDGYYFHVNSYDWLHAGTPISTPTTPVGLAVERGTTSVSTVSNATNASPIQVTTNTSHGLSTGDLVTITGVSGNNAANGTFPITVVNSTNFTLDGSSGNGAYDSGGTAYKPTDFSTLTWHETTSQWRLVLNTSGNGTTLGTSQNLRILNSYVDGYASLGTTAHGTTTVASTGVIRIPNNQYLIARNAGSSSDIQVAGVDTLNRIKVGSSASDLVYMPGNLIVDGYIVHDGSGSNVATTGFVREQNNTTIVAFRNAANSANIAALTSNSSNHIIIGDAVNSGVDLNVATNSTSAFQVNSTTILEAGSAQSGASTPFNTNAFLRFAQSATAPTIGQVALTSGSGATLTIQAQATSANSQTGGALRLASGRGSGTSGFDGSIDFYTGTPTGSGTLKMTIHPTTAPVSTNNNSIQVYQNKFRFDTAQSTPSIIQDNVTTSSTTGQALTLQAQNATGVTSTGGNLVLTSGTGTTAAGSVVIQTGGTNQIVISPTQTTIYGNLLVGGTTTSVNSTVVELADRVIHVNSSANVFPGTTTAAPTQITGFSVDRGSTNTTTKRDYYGMFWVENDSYWKLATNTDGYTSETTLGTTLPLIAQYHMVQSSATVSSGTIPTTGGYRSLNNTVHSASRNAAGTQDLILVSTDSSNHLVWGAGTQNAGHQFNTTVSTIYDFQVAGVSTYTVTPISSGITTHSHASTVTAVVYKQADLVGATGATTTIQAQNATTTGGDLTLTSGTGVTAGNVNIQTGATTKLQVAPTVATFTLPTVQFATAVSAPIIGHQTDATNSVTAQNLTIQAQTASGTTSTGGNLILNSGNGTTTAGSVLMQVGGTTTASAAPNKFVFNRGRRRNVTQVTTTYSVVASDDFIAITTLSAPYTITLPASPVLGDTYEIKDATGNAGTNNVTISGNGVNIDGSASYLLTQPYESITVTYTNGQWSVT